MMTLDEARAFFTADRFAMEVTGITIDEIGPDYAKCSFIAEGRHQAAHGGVMGGAIYTLADFAFAVASNCGGRLTMTTESSIHYLSRAKHPLLTAECRCIKNGKTTCLFETVITDGAGNRVAYVTSGGMHLDK